jgi:hypothetical protein
VWDINGRQFYTLSVEADGRRNFETFDYAPHSESVKVRINGVEFESQQEFDAFAEKVRAVMGGNDGVHSTVQERSAAPAGTQPAGYQPAGVHGAGQDQGTEVAGGGRPSGDGGPAV